MRKITHNALVKAEACESQVQLFDRYMPRGGYPTLSNLEYAAKGGLNIRWLAYALLTSEAEKALQLATAEERRRMSDELAALSQLKGNAYKARRREIAKQYWLAIAPKIHEALKYSENWA